MSFAGVKLHYWEHGERIRLSATCTRGVEFLGGNDVVSVPLSDLGRYVTHGVSLEPFPDPFNCSNDQLAAVLWRFGN